MAALLPLTSALRAEGLTERGITATIRRVGASVATANALSSFAGSAVSAVRSASAFRTSNPSLGAGMLSAAVALNSDTPEISNPNVNLFPAIRCSCYGVMNCQGSLYDTQRPLPGEAAAQPKP